MTEQDRAGLDEYLLESDAIRERVEQKLLERWSPDVQDHPVVSIRGRVKTLQTLSEKVARGSSLDRIRDVIGLRLVADVSIDELPQLLGEAAGVIGAEIVKIADRLVEPMYGYRAVHLEVRVEDRPIEIQARTVLQHRWAELNESLGDLVGRDHRYKPLEEIPEEHKAAAGMLQDLADAIWDLEWARMTARDAWRLHIAIRDKLADMTRRIIKLDEDGAWQPDARDRLIGERLRTMQLYAESVGQLRRSDASAATAIGSLNNAMDRLGPLLKSEVLYEAFRSAVRAQEPDAGGR